MPIACGRINSERGPHAKYFSSLLVDSEAPRFCKVEDNLEWVIPIDLLEGDHIWVCGCIKKKVHELFRRSIINSRSKLEE